MSLLELLRHVVLPVITRMLREDEEITSLDVRSIASESRIDGTTEVTTYLSVTICGEHFQCPLQGSDDPPESKTVSAMRERFASDLQDAIAESGFAWGQLRTM